MGVGGQHHAPAALPPGKTQYPLYSRLGGPQGRTGQVQKISPPPGFDPRTVQPVASRYTDWAIAARLSLYTNDNKGQVKIFLNKACGWGQPSCGIHPTWWVQGGSFTGSNATVARNWYQCLHLLVWLGMSGGTPVLPVCLHRSPGMRRPTYTAVTWDNCMIIASI